MLPMWPKLLRVQSSRHCDLFESNRGSGRHAESTSTSQEIGTGDLGGCGLFSTWIARAADGRFSCRQQGAVVGGAGLPLMRIPNLSARPHVVISTTAQRHANDRSQEGHEYQVVAVLVIGWSFVRSRDLEIREPLDLALGATVGRGQPDGSESYADSRLFGNERSGDVTGQPNTMRPYNRQVFQLEGCSSGSVAIVAAVLDRTPLGSSLGNHPRTALPSKATAAAPESMKIPARSWLEAMRSLSHELIAKPTAAAGIRLRPSTTSVDVISPAAIRTIRVIEVPNRKMSPRVARTVGPSSLLYSSATGGPPTVDTYDDTPAKTPAPNSTAPFRTSRTPLARMRTATNTIMPMKMSRVRSVAMLSNHTPMAAPGRVPRKIQNTPRRSTRLRSRVTAPIDCGSDKNSWGTGASTGLIRDITGTARIAKPIPRVPWTAAANTTTTIAATNSMISTPRISALPYCEPGSEYCTRSGPRLATSELNGDSAIGEGAAGRQHRCSIPEVALLIQKPRGPVVAAHHVDALVASMAHDVRLVDVAVLR